MLTPKLYIYIDRYLIQAIGLIVDDSIMWYNWVLLCEMTLEMFRIHGF